MKGKRNTSQAYKKRRFLEYYRRLPIIKLSSGYAKICVDTATDWQKDDPKFSEAIQSAKSDWAEENVHGVKNREWLLERIMSEHFRQVSEIEHGATNELSEALDRLSKVLQPKK
jgi:hypothetical protein